MNKLGVKICEALGLPGDRVQDIYITILPEGVSFAEVDVFILEEDDTSWLEELGELEHVTINVEKLGMEDETSR